MKKVFLYVIVVILALLMFQCSDPVVPLEQDEINIRYYFSETEPLSAYLNVVISGYKSDIFVTSYIECEDMMDTNFKYLQWNNIIANDLTITQPDSCLLTAYVYTNFHYVDSLMLYICVNDSVFCDYLY